MTAPTTSLIQTLQQELHVFELIEEALEAQQNALLKQALPELEAAQETLTHLQGQALEHEQKRYQLLQALGRDVSMTRLIEDATQAETKLTLTTLRNAFQACIQRIQALQKKNRSLLKASEQRVQDTVQFWISLFSPIAATYSNTPDDKQRREQEEHHSLSTIIHSV